MAKYRKILVAFDGSVPAKNALIQAARIAREDKSWIKVLAVIPPYEGDLELIGVSNIKEIIEGPGRKILAEAREIADREDVHILTNLEQGEPYEKIVHIADDENCDLIVMGQHGLSNLERELMGGVTARVIGFTERNVLVVPDNSQLHWNKILLATDGSKASQHALEMAMGLARDRSAVLTAVTVVSTNDEFVAMAPEAHQEMVFQARKVLDGLKERAAAENITLEIVVREGEPHQAITELAAASGIDLIIMGSHGRRGLSRLLMGSVTERTIGYSSVPILVCH